ncbi:MAG: hypothetical protein IPN15_17815 [Saprospiraceae bacterium]|nr:hypothetical protein [Candidatus Vicinibacter affinis]
MSQFTKCIGILIWLLSNYHAVIAQMDQCKGLPAYFSKMGINPSKAYLSTTERNLVGMALIESEQPGNPNARIIKIVQDKSWKDKGYLGAICTDHFGNSYVLPSAKVNMLQNPFEKQNNIYKVDANSGKMEEFVKIPMERMPGSFNPFGVLGSFYDCSTKQLLVSTVAGSDERQEIGSVYSVDVITKQIKKILSNKDIYGLAVHMHMGKRILFLSSARESKLYSIELDAANNPIGKLNEELSILGIGPRGDDKIRKIRFTKDGRMQLFTVLFYYNLTSPSEEQQSQMFFTYDPTNKNWKLSGIE